MKQYPITTLRPSSKAGARIIDHIELRVQRCPSTYKPFQAVATAYVRPERQAEVEACWCEIRQGGWTETAARAAMVARIRTDEPRAFLLTPKR